MNVLSWIINAGALCGWVVQIKHRKSAFYIFTTTTVLSIAYFSITGQIPFLLRSIFYLGIDIATLWQIFKTEAKREEER